MDRLSGPWPRLWRFPGALDDEWNDTLAGRDRRQTAPEGRLLYAHPTPTRHALGPGSSECGYCVHLDHHDRKGEEGNVDAGADYPWARTFPMPLARAGLVNVDAIAALPLIEGSTDIAGLVQLTNAALAERSINAKPDHRCRDRRDHSLVG